MVSEQSRYDVAFRSWYATSTLRKAISETMADAVFSAGWVAHRDAVHPLDDPVRENAGSDGTE